MAVANANNSVNNELTSYRDLVINYLIRANSQVAHTLTHTKSTIDTCESFHFAGQERKKRGKTTAYNHSTLEDTSPAGVLLISATVAGFQGVPFAEWLAWARMLAKSGLNCPEPTEPSPVSQPTNQKQARRRKDTAATR